MRLLFRADASVEIGSGHVMRCATLAGYLAAAGHDVGFLCRDAPGNLNTWLEQQGMPVKHLSNLNEPAAAEAADISASKAALDSSRYDWIIVDHYQLGVHWETEMAELADHIMAIDDLGRDHCCHLLLDQNYPNPMHSRYRTSVKPECEVLLGPRFALVRPEFSTLRAHSLARRRDSVSRLLVFMGGTDSRNETTKVLNGIALAKVTSLVVDVIVGSGNPHRLAVEAACARLSAAALHVQTARMFELMAAADCAIGAGGSASWERCVLGLPALVTILAANQAAIAQALCAAGACQVLGSQDNVTPDDYANALQLLTGEQLRRMSHVAATICDGQGTARVATRLTGERGPNMPSGHLHA